jgi:hypothetical protein
MRLFRRAWDVQVGTLRLHGDSSAHSLDLSFDITKDTTHAPNTAQVRVFNLSPDHRRQIEETANLRLTVSAGYEDGMTSLFTGDVHVAESRRRRRASKKKDGVTISQEGVDVMTILEAQDAGRAYSSAMIQQSFAAWTSLVDVLRACVRAMGIGEGNLASADVPTTTYAEGTVVSGRAWRELDRLVRSAGLTWSVQDGVLQLLRGSTPLRQTAVRLSSSTGLVGSPAVDVDRTVSCTALLIPGLIPGRQVVLESERTSGSYRVKRVNYRGDTAGSDWYANLVLEAY